MLRMQKNSEICSVGHDQPHIQYYSSFLCLSHGSFKLPVNNKRIANVHIRSGVRRRRGTALRLEGEEGTEYSTYSAVGRFHTPHTGTTPPVYQWPLQVGSPIISSILVTYEQEEGSDQKKSCYSLLRTH
jgi:hypothetical protein